MTGGHGAAATDAAPDDRSCLDLKHLYLEELHRMNEIELQRLFEAQLTAQTGDERIPVGAGTPVKY